MKTLLSLAALFHTVTMGGFARHASAALIASLWEGILLAAAAGLCLHLLPRTTARLRFAIWFAAFMVLVALPLTRALVPVQTAHYVAAGLPASAPHLELDSRWSYALAALWLAAILVRAVHLALQAINLRSLWSSAVPAGNDLGAAHLESEMSRGNGSRSGLFRLFPKARKVQLCTSTELDRPSVIGFFSPRILIPAWLFDEFAPGELHQVVLHEMEHLRRRDDWLNLLQKIGLVLFPLSPALFWIDRRLATERELACDDGVLCRTHAPRAYATCLTALAERRLGHRRSNRLTVLALGAVGAIRRSEFSRRIESILESGRSGRASLNPVLARASAALLIAGVLGSAIVLAHAPQLVFFNDPDQTRTAFTQTVPAVTATRESSPARFQNVVFHPKQPAATGPAHTRPTPKLKAKPRRAIPETQIDVTDSVVVPSPNRRLLIRASWQQSAPQPVLLTLPDGRTFLATYATGPNQAGWLFIQL